MRRTAIEGWAFPRTAAQHAQAAFGWALRVGEDDLLIKTRVVKVVAPLEQVAAHVVQAPRIGFEPANRMRLALRIVAIPGILRQFLRVRAEGESRRRFGSAGVLPFRL